MNSLHSVDGVLRSPYFTILGVSIWVHTPLNLEEVFTRCSVLISFSLGVSFDVICQGTLGVKAENTVTPGTQ